MFFFLVSFSLLGSASSAVSPCPTDPQETQAFCNGTPCPVAFIFDLRNNDYNYTYHFFKMKFSESNLLFSNWTLQKSVPMELVTYIHATNTYINFQIPWLQDHAKTLSFIGEQLNLCKFVKNNAKGDVFRNKIIDYVIGPSKPVSAYRLSYTAVIFDSTTSNINDILYNTTFRPTLHTHNVDLVLLNTSRLYYSDEEIYDTLTSHFLTNESDPSTRANHVIHIGDTMNNTNWSEDYGIFSSTSQASECFQKCGYRNLRTITSLQKTDRNLPVALSKMKPFITPSKKEGIIIAISVAAVIIFIIFVGSVALMYFWYKKKRLQLFREVHEINTEEGGDAHLGLQIMYADVDIDYGEILGKGSTSVVYRAFLKTTAPLHKLQNSVVTARFSNCNVAIKLPTTYTYEEIIVTTRELEAYKRIKYHDDILACLGWVQVDSRKCLVFDLVIGGDLRKYVMYLRDRPKEEFKEREFLQMFR
uniref:Protein kinase domain-containing protein n=1 Tax=Steinernema glaseri TaxID=37863 RepID=A0A1I8ATP8_9BILA